MGGNLGLFQKDVQPQRHTQFGELPLIPLHQIQDLRPAWLHARQPELPANLRQGRDNLHPVPLLRRRPRRLQPRRPSADHQDRLGLPSLFKPIPAPFPLAPHRRVHKTGNPVIPAAPPPAHLIARDTAANILGPPLGHLARQMRIGDLPAHDRHHIRLARGKDGFGIVRRPHPGLRRDDRVLHHRFQPCRQRRRQLFAFGKGWDNAFKLQIAAKAAGDIINIAGRVMQANDLTQIISRQRHRIARRIADRQTDDEIRPTLTANTGDQLARKPGAVFQRPAPLVGPLVRPRGPELVNQRMIGRPNLYPLKAAGLRAARGSGVGLQDLINLGFGHLMAAVAVMVGRPARR